MRVAWCGAALLALLTATCGGDTTRTADRGASPPAGATLGDDCPVTQPPAPLLTPPREFTDFLRAGIQEPAYRQTAALLPPDHFWYGNEAAWLSLPSNGVLHNGKQPWWRQATGQLHILGRRLDGGAPDAPVPVAHVPNGYGDRGFQATGWTFPAPGCWLIVATVGDAELRFVVRVSLPAPGAVTR